MYDANQQLVNQLFQFIKQAGYSYSKDDLVSLLKGAAIVGGGAFLSYITTWYTNYSANHDMGIWAPVLTALYAVVLDYVKKGIGIGSEANAKMKAKKNKTEL
jgi:hypothetical protein